MSSRGKYEIDFTDCPLEFEASFGNQSVYIGINYNEIGDFYTVDLYDVQHKPIILGEKLVYGKNFWRRYVDPRVPLADILPLDESDQEHTVARSNLGVTVFLYEDSIDGDTSDQNGGDEVG